MNLSPCKARGSTVQAFHRTACVLVRRMGPLQQPACEGWVPSNSLRAKDGRLGPWGSRTHVALGRRVAGSRAERRHVRPGPGLLESRPRRRRAPAAALLRRDGVGSCVHGLEPSRSNKNQKKKSTPQLAEGIYYYRYEQDQRRRSIEAGLLPEINRG
jgi:hypothetical protein